MARWCPLLAAPVPPGVCDLLPGAWRWFFPGLANGKSSILTGLCWGLPRRGAGGCGRPPSEGRVVQLGVGHVLGGFRCGSLRGGWCVRWGAWGPGEEEPICCASVHPSRNPPHREDRGAPPAFVSISGAHRAPVPSWGPASHLFCWRETVRQDRRLLGPPPSSS